MHPDIKFVAEIVYLAMLFMFELAHTAESVHQLKNK